MLKILQTCCSETVLLKLPASLAANLMQVHILGKSTISSGYILPTGIEADHNKIKSDQIQNYFLHEALTNDMYPKR